MRNERKAGIILSYCSIMINIAANLIYIPIILTFLTKEDYGVYQLICSLLVYVAIMHFGLGSTITRYYSRIIIQKDEMLKQNILAISLIIYFVLTILIIIIGIFLFFSIDLFYSSSLTSLQLIDAKNIFVVSMLNIIITTPANMFDSILIAHEKFIFIKTVNLIQSFVQPFAIICAIAYFPNALSIVIIQTIISVCIVLLKIYFSFLNLKIKIKLYFFDVKLIKEMLMFSIFVFINIVINQMYWQSDKIILGSILGATSVAIYSVAAQFNSYFMQLSVNISDMFTPQIYQILSSKNDMAQINNIFKKVGRIQFIVISLILTGFIIFGKQFISFWLGESFSSTYFIALAIMIPALFTLIEHTGFAILEAKNMHWFRALVGGLMAILNIILSVFLAKKYGGIGCAFATGLTMFLGNTIFLNIYYHKKIGIDICGFFKTISKLAIPIVTVFFMGMIIIHLNPPLNFFDLFIGIILYTLLFSVLVWIIGLNEYEKVLCVSILQKLRKI